VAISAPGGEGLVGPASGALVVMDSLMGVIPRGVVNRCGALYADEEVRQACRPHLPCSLAS
jgi:hypothetical protein